MRILLLSSGFNGLTQRVWLELRQAGHEVTVELAVSPEAMCEAVRLADPDLIICPFLRERVPAEIWRQRRTVIIHPGPKGDRGPSSLDWAISDGEPVWGVTALQAVEEMDAGPVWGSLLFGIGPVAPRKSELYNGPVADAAVQLVGEVVGKATVPTFVPEPLDYARWDVIGRLRPAMRQADRTFCWSDDVEHVLRRIRAADGSPGVRVELAGVPVYVYDAHPGPAAAGFGPPGSIAATQHGAVLVRTGTGAGAGTLWIGHVRRPVDFGGTGFKLPATMALSDVLPDVPNLIAPLGSPQDGYPEISYRGDGDIGWLTFDFYNGAMSTRQCRRLAAALRYAIAQPTRALVLRGGEVFSNGIHLNVIEASAQPAAEAWRNINAIDDACREILTCTDQLVVAAVAGNAGAGGVMLAMAADTVLLRDGAVLNPHYRTMGLYGSEYWTYVLPRRVGPVRAESLTAGCLPLGAREAARIGLAEEVLPRPRVEFEAGVAEHVRRQVSRPDHDRRLAAKRDRREADERRKPLDAYRAEELAEMSRDLFADRAGFAALRRAFVTRARPTATPGRIAGHRPATCSAPAAPLTGSAIG